ncbi:MAG TPA: hypothetical protein DHD79_06790 [Firmicutes bacterium]|jgi:hypothetical protein|nr:hypothetical protein [Bacillota bacterium]HBE06834.1 hypothetical protein [Bacillota bacterium]HBR23131.1 hypothetical protein [Bacillota bacterium]HCX70936.1 hypothetical protein [Bacillota bacterium]
MLIDKELILKNSQSGVLRSKRRLRDLIMNAFGYTRYGSPGVLELKEVGKPVPGAGKVLVKVKLRRSMLTIGIFLLPISA